MKANKIIPFVVSSLALVALPAFAGTDAASKLKKLDANADGRVSRSEFLAGTQEKIQRADTNRDGVVSAAEATVTKSDKKPMSSRGDKPASADVNNDGQVTQAEAGAAAEASFDKIDTTADGYLSVTELEAAYK